MTKHYTLIDWTTKLPWTDLHRAELFDLTPDQAQCLSPTERMTLDVQALMHGQARLRQNGEGQETYLDGAKAVKVLFGKRLGQNPWLVTHHKRRYKPTIRLLRAATNDPWGDKDRERIAGYRPATALQAHEIDLLAAMQGKLAVFTYHNRRHHTGLPAAFTLARAWLAKLRQIDDAITNSQRLYWLAESQYRANQNYFAVETFRKTGSFDPATVRPKHVDEILFQMRKKNVAQIKPRHKIAPW